MRKAWRYYRFVAHLFYSTRDFDNMRRLTTKNCTKAHSTENSLRTTYEHVLSARHGKSKRWRRRLARALSGLDIKSNQPKPHDLFSDIYSGAKDERYVNSHKAEHTSDIYICLTSKGERLRSFPFGTLFGILEYEFNAYPRTIYVIFAAGVGVAAGLLARYLS
jgi:hypothetical protein